MREIKESDNREIEVRDSRVLRNTLSHSLEVETLTQMHLNATEGKTEKEKQNVQKRGSRREREK